MRALESLSMFHQSSGIGTTGLSPGSWIPRADIYEDTGEFTLQVDVPGLTQEDVELQYENRVLAVRGLRKTEKGFEPENFYQKECQTGRFQRAFQLPSAIDGDKISASIENGVLRVMLPKVHDPKVKPIPVTATTAQQRPRAQR